MLRNLLRRLLGRDDEGRSAVKRDRLLTRPADADYDDRRAANEAFDAGVRAGQIPPGGGGPA